MPTPILKLTADELKAKVNPMDEPGLFRYGNGPKMMSEAAVIELLSLEENNILSALPEHYRRVVSGEVSGDILVNKDLGARGGETTVTVSLAPVVANTVVLYKNFSSNRIPWISRNYDHAMAAADYTIDLATGVVTLAAPLAVGDFIYAEYRHDAGARIATIRDLVLKSARCELYSMFRNWSGASEIIEVLREGIEAKILEFNAGDNPKGVQEIDDMVFVVDTRRSHRDTLRLPYMRGAI